MLDILRDTEKYDTSIVKLNLNAVLDSYKNSVYCGLSQRVGLHETEVTLTESIFNTIEIYRHGKDYSLPPSVKDNLIYLKVRGTSITGSVIFTQDIYDGYMKIKDLAQSIRVTTKSQGRKQSKLHVGLLAEGGNTTNIQGRLVRIWGNIYITDKEYHNIYELDETQQGCTDIPSTIIDLYDVINIIENDYENVADTDSNTLQWGKKNTI